MRRRHKSSDQRSSQCGMPDGQHRYSSTSNQPESHAIHRRILVEAVSPYNPNHGYTFEEPHSLLLKNLALS